MPWPWLSLALLVFYLLVVVRAFTGWSPDRPRVWIGRKVSVLVHERVYQTRIIVVWSDRAVASVFEAIETWRRDYGAERSMPTGNLWFRDEGTTWCLGWGSEQAKALEVAAALKAS